MDSRPIAISRRLALRQPPYDAEVEKAIRNTAFSGLSPLNLRLALANHPKLGAAFQSMAHVVLFKCAVPERDREIAIIRTGALTRSEYEWGMHVSIYGEKCGLGETHVRELTGAASWRELSEAVWTPAERLVVRMVDELHRHSTVADETWDAMVATWPQDQGDRAHLRVELLSHGRLLSEFDRGAARGRLRALPARRRPGARPRLIAAGGTDSLTSPRYKETRCASCSFWPSPRCRHSPRRRRPTTRRRRSGSSTSRRPAPAATRSPGCSPTR
jgi:hypothetical protein